MKFDIGYQGVAREAGLQFLRLLVGLAVAMVAFAFGFMALEFGVYYANSEETAFLIITTLLLACIPACIIAGVAIDDHIRAEI